jgi:hypothetical protein
VKTKLNMQFYSAPEIGDELVIDTTSVEGGACKWYWRIVKLNEEWVNRFRFLSVEVELIEITVQQ